MWDNPFEFKYDAKGDYYDIVVDKKIQAVVDELKKLPHVVLIRYMTYWMDDVDNGKYEVESDYCDGKFFLNCADLDRANYSFSYNGE